MTNRRLIHISLILLWFIGAPSEGSQCHRAVAVFSSKVHFAEVGLFERTRLASIAQTLNDKLSQGDPGLEVALSLLNRCDEEMILKVALAFHRQHVRGQRVILNRLSTYGSEDEAKARLLLAVLPEIDSKREPDETLPIDDKTARAVLMDLMDNSVTDTLIYEYLRTKLAREVYESRRQPKEKFDAAKVEALAVPVMQQLAADAGITREDFSFDSSTLQERRAISRAFLLQTASVHSLLISAYQPWYYGEPTFAAPTIELSPRALGAWKARIPSQK